MPVDAEAGAGGSDDEAAAGEDAKLKDQKGQSSGMSQSSKDDIGVCVVIILITILAIIVTVIKIILIDVPAYPELFGIETTTMAIKTTTEDDFRADSQFT